MELAKTGHSLASHRESAIRPAFGNGLMAMPGLPVSVSGEPFERLFFLGGQGRCGLLRPFPARAEDDEYKADQQENGRRYPENNGMKRHDRAQQHELAVTRDDIVDDLGIGIARNQPFAYEQAKIARQFGVRIVDRLVLAHKA